MASCDATLYLYLPTLPVEFDVYVVQMLVGHMGVDLCGSYICMPKKCLYATEIGAVLEKVGRKTMTNDVRRDLARNARPDGVLLYQSLNGARSEAREVFGIHCDFAVTHKECVAHEIGRAHV